MRVNLSGLIRVRRNGGRDRRPVLAALMAALLAAVLAPAGTVLAAAAPVTVTIEPYVGGKLVVGRIAPAGNGSTGRWVMNYSFLVKNNCSCIVRMTSASMTVRLQTKTDTNDGAEGNPYGLGINPGASVRFNAKGSFSGGLPAPTTATAKLTFAGYDVLTKTVSVGIHRNPTPRGAYDLPLRASDIPSSTYWGNSETTNEASHHHADIAQHFAYDVLGYRWNGSKWVSTLAGKTSPWANDDFIGWNRPLFAIGSGTIIECRRFLPDLTPGTKDPDHRFGNAVWIRLTTGEIVGYAHMKQFSLDPKLCPRESVAQADGAIVHAQPIAVYAGQPLGRVGNSGNSSEPHLHIQVMKNEPLDVDDSGSRSAPGLPLTFDSFQARTRVGLTQGSGFGMHDVPDGAGHMLPDYGLLIPHPCGYSPPAPGAGEHVLNVTYSCFQERVNDVTRAGYVPVAIDGYNVGSANYFNIVFRPSRTATAWYAGMSSATYQSRLTSLATGGHRLLHVDSFMKGSAVQYAAVWVKQAGPATVAYHGKTLTEHTQQFNSLTGQGYRPAVVSVVAPGGSQRFTAIYRLENVGSYVTSTVREVDFQTRFNTLTGLGYRPTYVDGYTINGVVHFSYIFTSGASSSYVMKTAMTFSSLGTNLGQNVGAGRLTVALTGYDRAGTPRFGAIWR